MSVRLISPRRELAILLAAWLLVALIVTAIALQNRSAPGLYYDEAVFAGLAKDFVDGTPGVLHMPGTQFVELFGRPFPIFVQSYFGAFKSWLIIPSFLLFGCSVAVLRMTALFWCLVGLLFCLLWTRKLLGLPAALVAAFLLGFDPSFFFLSVLDWGGVVPSFLCRSAGFFFLLLWFRRPSLLTGLPAAVFLGLGVYSKIDFVVVLLGTGLAAALAYKDQILAVLDDSRRQFAFCCGVFFFVSSPMFTYLTAILEQAVVMASPSASGGVLEKLKIAQAMYDGSYFYRLMEVGGVFEKMFAKPSPVWSPFGLAIIVSAAILSVRAVRLGRGTPSGRAAIFLLSSLVLITIGVLLLPGAVRMHHSILVYPFPHLAAAAAIVLLREAMPSRRVARLALRACAIITVCLVLAGHFNSILQTQRLIAATGGRGYWSGSLEGFCRDIRDQPNLTIVSLDWGFNEQLDLLSDNKHLSEPIWPRMQPQKSTEAVYLVHPLEYTLFRRGEALFNASRHDPTEKISISTYKDRQGNVAFYAFRFPAMGRASPQRAR